MKIETVPQTLLIVKRAKTFHIGIDESDLSFSLVVETDEGETHGISFTREDYHTLRASLDAVATGLWGRLQ